MEDIEISEVIEAVNGSVMCDGKVAVPFMGADPHSLWVRKLHQKVKGVSIDSRSIKPGELFVALKGRKNDGHLFVGEAIKKGAVGVIINKESRISGNGVPFIVVDDTLSALGNLASWYRNRFSLPIVGITGSNGKTTTKELTAKCLSIRYQVCKNEGSLNSLTGVPLSLFNLLSKHEIGVLEVGANQVGEIRRLASIVKPKIAVITNIAPTHLEHFKTVEKVMEEKLDLARASEVAILNADDPFLGRAQIKAFRFGIEKGELRASTVEENNGIRFKIKDVPFHLPLVGVYQVYNALAAVAVGIQFELELNDMSDVLNQVSSVPHRDEIIETNGIKIIDSSYNANPVSMELAIRELSKYKGVRKVAILGDMLELGEKAYDFHIKIGELLKGLGIDVIIGYGELARGYIEKLKVKSQKSKIYYFTEMELLKKELQNIIKSEDVILVKGSRAMRMEGIVDWLSG